mmetsp:Transcript_41340/g.104775  ORF Transcript_41340/g.104775 Transcript_41340/m.104775 type:complete len:421 (-) Transcript_41340:305-1567(-)
MAVSSVAVRAGGQSAQASTSGRSNQGQPQRGAPVSLRQAVWQHRQQSGQSMQSNQQLAAGQRRRSLDKKSVPVVAFFGGRQAAPPRRSTTEALTEAEPAAPVSLGWPLFDTNRFELESKLGSGSFGTVYKALDSTTGEHVAVKKLSKLRKNQKPSRTSSKLQREADLLQMMQGATENVVRNVGRFEDESYVYLVTEVLSGGTLEQWMADAGGKLGEDDARWVLADVLDFIAGCHNRGLVYADAKPANFMLDDSEGEWRVKAIDMGCAQSLPYLGARLELRSGTPLYFAPEVFERSYAEQADMWSVGVMLYQLVTGRNPWFTKLAGVTPNDVMEKVMGSEVPYYAEDWDKLSPELQSLVRQMLEKDATKRISPTEALCHPWMQSMYETGIVEEEAVFANNVVPLKTYSKLASLATPVAAAS